MQLRQLKEHFAAAVTGIDLAQAPGTELGERVRQLHREYPVLAFESQHLTAAEFLAVCQIFGEIERDHHLTQFADPDVPDVIYLVNYHKDGTPNPSSADRGSVWHADSTYKSKPCAHTALYALEIPVSGGGTMFADMYCAFDTLPHEVKTRIDGRTARHLFGGGSATGGVIPLTEEQRAQMPSVEQPAVLIHPDTGRKALYVNPLHTVEIVGLDRAESDALLRFIFEHATRAEFVYHHHWQVGQFVLWDQRCTLHRAEAKYASDQRRRLMRAKMRQPS